MDPPPLILASSSRYRREQLSRLGIPFTYTAPNIDESPDPNEPADDLVRRLARQKAAAVRSAVAKTHPNALIIGSDQLAYIDGQILGKPGTEERAHAQLSLLSGNTVSFLTSVCLLDCRSNEAQIAVDDTRVTFRALLRAQIVAYIAKEQPLDCAGAFKSEGLGIALFESIQTSDPNALIGLPLIQLCSMLRNAGIDVLTHQADD